MAEEVIVEVRDGIQVIRINRPGKKNALKRDMYDRMGEALIAGDASNDVAAHVFLGVNGVFTAGNDISDFANQGGAPRDNKHGAPGFIRLLPMAGVCQPGRELAHTVCRSRPRARSRVQSAGTDAYRPATRIRVIVFG
jgi:hypothetical protein